MEITIHDLPIPLYLGYYPEEQRQTQDALLTLKITVSEIKQRSEDLNLTVDYAAVVAMIDREISGKSFKLIETVVTELGSLLLEHFALILALEVKLTKRVFPSDALRGATVSITKKFSRGGKS